MTDYLGLILTGFFTGFGVVAGQEFYQWMKNRSRKAKEKIAISRRSIFDDYYK